MLIARSISLLSAKKVLISALLIGLGAIALASMGGGGSKSKDKAVKPEFTPIRTTNGFTLKAGPAYKGSMIFGQEKTKSVVAYNSIVTYRKAILPTFFL